MLEGFFRVRLIILGIAMLVGAILLGIGLTFMGVMSISEALTTPNRKTVTFAEFLKAKPAEAGTRSKAACWTSPMQPIHLINM